MLHLQILQIAHPLQKIKKKKLAGLYFKLCWISPKIQLIH